MDAETHRQEVEAWRDRRYEALRREQGWLTLAGLHWLKPGPNRVGSDPDADVILPAGPPEAGVIEVHDDGRVTATGTWTHRGEPVEVLPLVDDASGEPTILELGDLRQCLIVRGGTPALRTWNLASPARETFSGIPHWPVDLAWRIEGRFEPTPGRRLRVPDVLGIEEDEESPGDVVFEIGGVTHRLQALPGGPNGELWLVFGDLTNGKETYRGGRFLYTDPPSDDGRVVVDFNRAYNPPCVFSPYATCPLPWPGNRLPIRVEAGERLPEGAEQHTGKTARA
ncbi:MAG TPA: DUF1684 domain-containing protein [Candidatus Limnocylindria bacterium]|nr:DUF1684 domain-containing protein [Candidatus Limnocylindria bacterium]